MRVAVTLIAAILSAIQLGADYVELDVRTTSDEMLALMNDKTLGKIIWYMRSGKQ